MEGALWVQRVEESGRVYQLLPAGLQVSCQVAHIDVVSVRCLLLRVQRDRGSRWYSAAVWG